MIATLTRLFPPGALLVPVFAFWFPAALAGFGSWIVR